MFTILAQNLLQLSNGNNSLILIIKKILTYSFFLLLLVNASLCFSQIDSLEVHTINCKEYYIHIVEKGESLYAIGKKYEVPIPIIQKENPGVADGLSIGEKVFIPIKRNEDTSANVDGNFITHTVEKQQTLYSIAKLYDVQQNEIITVNPELSEGLKEGQTIKIPVKKLKPVDNQTSIIPESKYPTHVVKQGETLYSLSKLYDVTVDAIKEANGGLIQGLREGETIYIPTKKKIIKSVVIGKDTLKNPSATAFESVIKKSEYKIGLMLPFYLDENDDLKEKRSALEEEKIYPRSKFAIEFYNGFIKALNEASTDSCKFKVYVYDTKGNDTLRTRLLLSKPELKELDLIVGPLYYSNFELVAEFAKEHKIPIVSPVKQNNKVLLGNQYVFKVIPSKTSIINPIVSLVADSFKTENLLVIDYEKSKERALVDIYLNSYSQTLAKNTNDTNIYPLIKKINITTNFDAVVSQLKPNKNNVIFAPCSDQSYITGFFGYLITTLNKREYKDYKITMIGLEEWSQFENIDLDYFQRLNVHYCSPQHVDEGDSLVSSFVSSYVESYKTYPSKSTLLGYDLASFFSGALITDGTLFSDYVMNTYEGKSIKINFVKTGIESGYENNSTFLVRYYDYILEKLK